MSTDRGRLDRSPQGDESLPKNRVAKPVTIETIGSGTCSYTLDFGDGNRDTRSRQFPDHVRHNYPAPDKYTVAAAANPPCSGSARTTLVIRPRR
ncbi:MAG: hypothetical protein DMF84_06255 [Acidobacteria bacterium]|nr:MAG: hypothetical protein DMF84_06255 [Acidobacteriota bacterium]